MQKLFFFLILGISLNAYSQSNLITIGTLEKLAKMNITQVEDWALKNDLTYDEIKEYSLFNVISFRKGNFYAISVGIFKDGSPMGSVTYDTRSSADYLKLKAECSNYGYNFVQTTNSSTESKRVFHIYRSNNFELSFNISNQSEYFGFCVGIGPLTYNKN